MEIIDTHTHLYLEQFEDDFDEVMERSFKSWVNGYLVHIISVSIAMLIRREIGFNDFVKYVLAQVLGSAFAAYIVYAISSNIVIQPNLDESVYAILLAELLFTYLLILVILNIACHPKVDGNSFYGLAYGLTVMVGIYAVGPLSGGVFNPAVSIGPSIIDLITGGGTSQYFVWYYLTAPIIGSVLAVITFNYILKKWKIY